jgi:hypothetical protein
MYLINEVARRVNLSHKRIREYEAEGFIKTLRDANTNNRRYSDFEVAQIARITQLIHERGFTLACLRNLLILAPCWNIFGCAARRRCAAYRQPHLPCWQIRARQKTLCPGPCQRCAIFLNRDSHPEGVLEHSGAEAMEGGE